MEYKNTAKCTQQTLTIVYKIQSQNANHYSWKGHATCDRRPSRFRFTLAEGTNIWSIQVQVQLTQNNVVLGIN